MGRLEVCSHTIDRAATDSLLLIQIARFHLPDPQSSKLHGFERDISK